VQRSFWPLSPVLFLFVLITACSPTASFVLYIDPYEHEVLESKGIDRQAVRQLVSGRVSTRIVVAPPHSESGEGLQHFSAVVERTNPEWVYLSVAHPFTPPELIRRYPEIRFFREGYAGALPENQVVLVYDRDIASFKAGEAIAVLLADPGFRESIGVTDTAAGEPRVGILAAAANITVEREIESFVEGFTSLESAERIERRDIGSLSDRVKARSLMEDMKESGVSVFVLKTYVLGSFCLEYLAKEGGIAVVDAQIPQQAYGDTVLLMLVDDFPAAVNRMVEYINGEDESNGEQRFTVPVRLEWNETYRPRVMDIIQGVQQQ